MAPCVLLPVAACGHGCRRRARCLSLPIPSRPSLPLAGRSRRSRGRRDCLLASSLPAGTHPSAPPMGGPRAKLRGRGLAGSGESKIESGSSSAIHSGGALQGIRQREASY
eukprot:958682-Prorocentrum_minimum.AAC.2